jgi:hypothetical protein
MREACLALLREDVVSSPSAHNKEWYHNHNNFKTAAVAKTRGGWSFHEGNNFNNEQQHFTTIDEEDDYECSTQQQQE